MSRSLELVIFYLHFLTVAIFAELGAGQHDCSESRCKHHGPAIRFPFRRKGLQPDHCGYPGFDLGCNEKKQTGAGAAIFSGYRRRLIACPNGYHVCAVVATDVIYEYPLLSIGEVYNISSVPYVNIFYNKYVPINWSRPECGNCEAEGKKCRLKKNYSTEPETECFNQVRILCAVIFLAFQKCCLEFTWGY
ncbi:hypothetical protein L1049_016067 [Liquidambar formosana]|uniref:RING-type E3 ubiquitin transferase n=1 Tax=Liquidambar formosana TaxID=63359 RepID=A0AAP0S5T7_LIQFO